MKKKQKTKHSKNNKNCSTSGKHHKSSLFDPDVILSQIKSDLLCDLTMKSCTSQNHVMSGSQRYFLNQQRINVSKKYIPLTPDHGVTSTADSSLELFHRINEHMGHYSNREGLGLPELKSDFDVRSQCLRTARNVIYNILRSPPDEEELFLLSKNSTGTSIGVKFYNTQIEGKLTHPISGKSRVKTLVDQYLIFNKQLNTAIETFNGEGRNPGYLKTESSRAATVPKTNKIDRMIAVEPTWNMFFQQGLMLKMFDRLACSGLDVRSLPDKHKRLAMESSITGRNATIDFSSASDCLSYDLVKWLIPPDWFHMLDQVRSPTILIKGEKVRLNMFSTMGNAVTFPLETLVFYGLAVSAVHHTNLKPGHKLGILPSVKTKESCSVFGDDCILPTEAVPMFLTLCESVGFIVNKEKSYYNKEGGFRESCGGDYYHGVDVRSLYIKAPTSTSLSALEPWLYIIANGLLKKYISYFGNLNYIYDKRVFKRLELLFKEHNLFLKIVPSNFPDDSGLKIADDYQRFKACYDFRTSKIVVDENGTCIFRYCKYIYRVNEKTSFELRYASWLLKVHLNPKISELIETSAKLSASYRVKKGGGYIVAKSRGHIGHLFSQKHPLL